jgi:hypothetical protein
MPRKSKMNIDMKTINIIGLVVIVGLSIYIYMLLEQIQTPTEGCKPCEDNISIVYDDTPPEKPYTPPEKPYKPSKAEVIAQMKADGLI